MAEFNLTFLGTSACDFSPKLDDECKDKFDREARRAACVLMNEKYLIDCGVHCCNSLDIINKDYSEITDIFFTHMHGDHFYEESVKKIASVCKKPLRLWVREDSVVPHIPNTEIVRMKLEEKYAVNEEMTVVPLITNHVTGVYPQWLLFEKGEKKFLYALDGAWLMFDTYEYLKDMNLDLIILDATVGTGKDDYRIAEHNSLPMIKLMLPSLKKVKIINDDTRILLSHIAPSLHKSHRRTERLARRMRAEAAYDGMKITI